MIFWSQNRKVMQMKFGVVTYTVCLLLHARYGDDGLKGLGIDAQKEINWCICPDGWLMCSVQSKQRWASSLFIMQQCLLFKWKFEIEHPMFILACLFTFLPPLSFCLSFPSSFPSCSHPFCISFPPLPFVPSRLLSCPSPSVSLPYLCSILPLSYVTSPALLTHYFVFLPSPWCCDAVGLMQHVCRNCDSVFPKVYVWRANLCWQWKVDQLTQHYTVFDLCSSDSLLLCMQITCHTIRYLDHINYA